MFAFGVCKKRANIPKEKQAIECISYAYNGFSAYELYKGPLWQKANAAQHTARISAIAAQKMAISS